MSHKIDFERIAWEAPLAGLRHKAMCQGNQRLRLVEYTRDLEPHWCELGHIGLVLEGEFEIRFDDEVCVYHPGDGIFIPPGSDHRHMGRVLSDTVRVVFVEDA
jgi:hypothetical protein